MMWLLRSIVRGLLFGIIYNMAVIALVWSIGDPGPLDFFQKAVLVTSLGVIGWGVGDLVTAILPDFK